HVDIEKELAPDKLRDALNFHLKPAPIAVLAAEVAAPDFHARFSATGRAYLYRIVNRRAPLTVDRSRAWRVGTTLDAAAMHEAAQVLVGTHDFTTFRATECQSKTPVKTLDRLSVHRVGEDLQVIAEARSFLHHQVRNIVGTLRLVGGGKWTKDDVAAALEACDRTRGGPTAPPDGLYLTRVSYDVSNSNSSSRG
ncbi:MAG TPA: tRNA pseudouridine synthase A, partial [Dongiaceae bacterium]